MQEIWVWSRSRRTPHATEQLKLVRQNYWVYALEPGSFNYWAHAPQSLCSAAREATAMRRKLESSSCLPQLEKSLRSNEDPAQSEINDFLKSSALKKLKKESDAYLTSTIHFTLYRFATQGTSPLTPGAQLQACRFSPAIRIWLEKGTHPRCQGVSGLE